MTLAPRGRANPAGISYLYLSSLSEASIAEVRPHPGEQISVAEFVVQKSRVLDLREPRKRVSPFLLESREDLEEILAVLPLLERLGEELSKPVLPASAAYEYTPSQYLCEFVKSRNFDGVLYRSSVSDGVNLALFDPDRVEALRVDTYRVDRVAVDTSPVGQ